MLPGEVGSRAGRGKSGLTLLRACIVLSLVLGTVQMDSLSRKRVKTEELLRTGRVAEG